jgi:hypothetical protein
MANLYYWTVRFNFDCNTDTIYEETGIMIERSAIKVRDYLKYQYGNCPLFECKIRLSYISKFGRYNENKRPNLKEYLDIDVNNLYDPPYEMTLKESLVEQIGNRRIINNDEKIHGINDNDLPMPMKPEMDYIFISTNKFHINKNMCKYE